MPGSGHPRPGLTTSLSSLRGKRPVLVLALTLALGPAPASAWIYSEHRAITAQGIGDLGPKHRGALDRLWQEARPGFEARLCEQAVAGDAGGKPACIDLAAWPAIAGDHSCTPEDMLQAILESEWILAVADVAGRTGDRIGRARNEAERRNFQALGDLGLERADRAYSTRAGSNNAHFLLPRADVSIDPALYAAATLRAGAELNAVSIYVLSHIDALHRAALLSKSDLPAAERAASVQRTLAIEAFALHFLEDSFAAGHIAGSWGPVAERKGTHDYYNEHGLDTTDWANEALQLFGDGHMRDEDLKRAGHAVALSLEELADALEGGSAANRDAASVSVLPSVDSGTFDVCKEAVVPEWAIPQAMAPYLQRALRVAPIPFRGPGFASLPRFRAEIGSFMGVASGISGTFGGGGFTDGSSGGAQGSLEVGLRFGLGLDALLGDAGDGLIFVQAGITAQSRSSSGCTQDCPTDPLLQQFIPGVPARSGLSFRLRLPFWLIPGDLVLAAPVLAFTNVTALKKMGIQAADGGLLPWQRRISTPIGGVQFMAGREVGVTLFGYGEKDAFLAILDTPEGPSLEPIAIKSIQWEFPIVEYRPFREYGSRYSAAAFLQLGAGIDRPVEVVVVGRPDATPPVLRTRYYGFVRIFFDGRRYF
jgi:hypothetical protein